MPYFLPPLSAMRFLPLLRQSRPPLGRALFRCLDGPEEQFARDDLFVAKLSEALQAWPLYRRLEYSGADQVVAVPQQITLFCPQCGLDSFWETYSEGEYNRQGLTQKEYTCKNCGRGTVTYYFYWMKDEKKATSVFFKVGQYPEPEERVPESLREALSREDLKMYKNALRMRNFNRGIAAVAYMRRVVENRMSDILEVLYEAASAHDAPPEVLARHGEMRKEKRFSVKVDYAGELLPRNLHPEGKPNPMAVLHELASEALHTKSDEECVDIFDACRKTFEYVFGKMRIETEDAKSFVKGVTQLAEKRAKVGDTSKGSGIGKGA